VVSNGAPQGTNYGSSRQVDGQVSGQGGFGYSMSAGASGDCFYGFLQLDLNF